MAPKKDAKAAGGAPSQDDVIAAYKAQNDALQAELEKRTQKLLAAEESLQQLTNKLVSLGKTAAAGDAALADIHAEATRQYRSMQLRYEDKITNLESDVSRLNAEVATLRRNAVSQEERAAAALKAKDEHILKLSRRIDDMAGEFGDMMAEVMRRLAAKIDVSTEEGGIEGQMEQGQDVAAATLKKMQEMTI